MNLRCENEWHETSLIYRRKESSEHDDHRQYSVFMTNCGSGHLTEYGYRWEIESGYRSIKRFMAATTSKHFGLRFFYFAFACLLYSIWRTVDLLVQVELTGVRTFADRNSRQYADAAEEGNRNRVVTGLSPWSRGV